MIKTTKKNDRNQFLESLDDRIKEIEKFTNVKIWAGRYAHFPYLQAVYELYSDAKKLKARKSLTTKLLGKKVSPQTKALGAIIIATSEYKKQQRAKYVAQLRAAHGRKILPENLISFLKGKKNQPAKKAVSKVKNDSKRSVIAHDW